MQGIVVGVLALITFLAAFLYYIISMPGRPYSGPLPPLSAQAEGVRGRLMGHVEMLASHIGERNALRGKTLDAAAAYIEAQFTQAGFTPEVQNFGSGARRFKNLQAILPGQDRADEIIVLGAHYDTVWGSPGADDNASGVAALLEIAGLLSGKRFSRSVRFVAFGNEEEPFFATAEMGSLNYARQAQAKGERIIGMISIESVGVYLDGAGTQAYPPPLKFFYPDVGSFIAFVGNLASRGLVRHAIASFRARAQFPSEGIAAPEPLAPDIIRSDHFAFWQAGFPAMMVTDTANFRYPYYHTALDTWDQLDYGRLAQVVIGLAKMLEDLATGKPGLAPPR
ncbi:MAG: M28 family peptidase [Gammaproteobacteria bacterium]|nr:M28 family peptidase [Gammaproteobacteria bacterium]